MQESLEKQDFTKFHSLNHKLIEAVDRMLTEDIAILMAKIPQEILSASHEQLLKGGVFTCVEETVSPFGYKRGEGN